MRVSPGNNRTSAGTGRTCYQKSIVKTHAFLRQSVNIGCFHDFISIATHIIKTDIIRNNEYDVGFSFALLVA